MRTSMAGWATLWLAGIAGLAGTLTLLAPRWTPIPWLAIALVSLVLAPVVAWSGARLTARWSRMARALNDGVMSLKDRDFSVSVRPVTSDELGALGGSY